MYLSGESQPQNQILVLFRWISTIFNTCPPPPLHHFYRRVPCSPVTKTTLLTAEPLVNPLVRKPMWWWLPDIQILYILSLKIMLLVYIYMYSRTSIKRPPIKWAPSIRWPFSKVLNYLSLNVCI